MRFGVLGCASIARRRMLPAMLRQPRVELVAVASRDAAKAERMSAEFGCAAVHGYGRLLERDDVEAVYLPLPPSLHGEWIEAALRAGKHVLVEKPLALDAAQARAAVDAAVAAGRLLAESFMFLYHGQHAQVDRLLAGGAVGEVRLFASQFGIPPLPPGDIRYQAGLGGGALLDVGVYTVRAASRFLGELEVVGSVLDVDPVSGVDLGGSALLRTPGGVAAHLQFGFRHGYRSNYALWGSRGHLQVERAFTPPPELRPLVRLETQGRREVRALGADDQFANIAGAFASAVRDGVPPDVFGADIVRQAALVEAIRAFAEK
ncbi:Gfo/Idh/MocA family protein [Marinactinospora rubrisoli]|uniref:Gfo/Idh/MocA family protein n=1 Tax=Marinactinospora rubrisoli TaxID=2715399 RepID=A0ABW2KMS8_9ACTN